MDGQYDGKQYVGIDLHRRRSVIVRMTPEGEQLGCVRVDNDVLALGLEIAKAGPDPEVVIEAMVCLANFGHVISGYRYAAVGVS